MTLVQDARPPDEFEIFKGGWRALQNVWQATLDFIEGVSSSGLDQFIWLAAIFVLVQGLSGEIFTGLKRLGGWIFRQVFSRLSPLGQLLYGQIAIVVTEYLPSGSAGATPQTTPNETQGRLDLLRVKSWISQGSYLALADLTQYFAKRGQGRLGVIGDKQSNGSGEYEWRFDQAPKLLVLGSQINNLAAEAVAAAWNKNHCTSIVTDNHFGDGQVGISMKDADGHELASIKTTRNAEGNGVDGAILIFSKRRVTQNRLLLQAAGCSALGTQALVKWLVTPSAQRTEFALKTLWRDDFVAFFEATVHRDNVGSFQLVKVLGCSERLRPQSGGFWVGPASKAA
jgi:hypothetical protein